MDKSVHYKAPIAVSQAESDAVAAQWYIAPTPPPPRGWHVYSADFVLATLQRCATERHKIRRTAGWQMLAALVRGVMAVFQAVIMLLAYVPVVSWFLETLARVFTRNPAGFFLRACYWKARLKHLGQDTIIDQGVEIWGPGNVEIGSCCHINTNVRLAAGEVKHGQHGLIRIGNYVHVGPGVHVAGRGGVEIGDFVGIMAYVHIYSATGGIENPHDPGQLASMSHTAPADRQFIIEAPVVVEDYAVIGMMAKLLPGVRIGKGAVIHSGAELTRNVLPFANHSGSVRGKQIGWRRPRRKSPHLAQPEVRPDGPSASSSPKIVQEPSIRA